MNALIPGTSIVLILTIGFAFASFFGYLAQRMHLSPIVGYLFAGYMIGPYSPGFVADINTAEQLAEIGVILMMFGVGMHFKWQDLYSVKGIAIPGAIVQTGFTALSCLWVLTYLGWSFEASLVIGIAIGVASTVVLVRILTENHIINTPQGHIAIGWLIVEDILTVFALLLLPVFVLFQGNDHPTPLYIIQSMALVLLKFFLMAALVLTVGKWLVTKAFFTVSKAKLEELHTITLLALILVITVGSTYLFGTSIALGSFAAGMVIGQTIAKHHAMTNVIPLKNTFAVLFFLSVGMLFKPAAIWENLSLFLIILTLILVVKPLVALAITVLLKYPVKTGLMVGVALAQIGEFSFILSEEALKLKILPDEGFDIIVACAMISIALNPLLFKQTLSRLHHKVV